MSDALTGEEMAAAFSKLNDGKTVKYNAVPVDVYASFGFPGADELANMFRFYTDNEEAFLKSRDIPPSVKKTMVGTVSFEDFLNANKEKFTLS